MALEKDGDWEAQGGFLFTRSQMRAHLGLKRQISNYDRDHRIKQLMIELLWTYRFSYPG